jgi:hypothetical protein
MAWAVFAPTTRRFGARAGHYGGASAEATVGLGVGANVLIGGSNRTVELQPVSVQGQAGLNLAVGVASLDCAGADKSPPTRGKRTQAAIKNESQRRSNATPSRLFRYSVSARRLCTTTASTQSRPRQLRRLRKTEPFTLRNSAP